MSELESILNYLETTSMEPHDDYTSEFSYKEQKVLWNYIKQLKGQLERSEKARKILKEINEYRKETGGYPSEMLDKLLDILNIDKGE